MWEKCFKCELRFISHRQMLSHMKKEHPIEQTIMDYNCIFCPKEFDLLEDMLHHMELDHVGISSQSLDSATKARETKKQLGEYVGEGAKGVNFECPHCFEIFPSSDKVNEHRKTIHQMQFTKDAQKKLNELPAFDEKTPPECEKCKGLFCGLVICKMNGRTQSVCLNCYENYYGVNALRRLTIGTPDDILKKMKSQIK